MTVEEIKDEILTLSRGDMAGSIAVRSRKEECEIGPVVFDEVSRGACL